MTRLVSALLVAVVLAACGAEEHHANTPESTMHERAEDLFQAGRNAAARGDTVRSEQYLSAAIERGYDRGKALPLLLRVCLSSSRLRAALTHAEPYLRDHPEDDALRYVIAIVHMGLGDADAARLDLTELLRHDQRNSDAHLLLGILDSRTDFTSARDHFRAYLDLAPHGRHAGEARSRLAELAVLAADRNRFARISESPWHADGLKEGDREGASTSTEQGLHRLPDDGDDDEGRLRSDEEPQP
jgi:Tfp pilus assembly protein PilF